MPYAIGIVLGLATAGTGIAAGFDRDRAFYPTILIVVAFYYVLFAVVDPSRSALVAESLVAAGFFLVAVVGFRTNLWLVAAALAGHGTFDLIHSRLIDNAGVPSWWPAFCMSIDVTLAVAMALRLIRRSDLVRPA
jgi:hypothetical protein